MLKPLPAEPLAAPQTGSSPDGNDAPVIVPAETLPPAPIGSPRWWREQVLETPGWFASLAVHAALVALLGVMATPPLHRMVSHLLHGEFVPNQTPDLHETPLLKTDNDFTDEVVLSAPAADPAHLAPLAVRAFGVEEPSGEGEDNAVPEAPTPEGRIRTGLPRAKLVSFERPTISAAEERELDSIVDRFIEYDLGHLSGAEGQQAREAFEKLGPSAVPALVRGLNKAAYIQGSCPVIVIRSKLGRTVAASSDPRLWRYALEHIGEGVAETAHHHSHIVGARNDIEQLRRDQAKLVDLEAALKSDDASQRLMALETIAVKQQLTAGDGMLVGQVAALREDPNPEIQATAQEALARLVERQTMLDMHAGNLPALGKLLRHEDHEVRLAALETIATKTISRPARSLFPLVDQTLTESCSADQDPALREAALAALGKIAQIEAPERSKLGTLAPTLTHRESSVRQATLAGLNPHEQPLSPELLARLEDADEGVQQQARMVVFNVVSSQIEQTPRSQRAQEIRGLLKHETGPVRAAALVGLEVDANRAQDLSLGTVLIECLSDSDPDVTLRARAKLLTLAGEPEDSAAFPRSDSPAMAIRRWSEWHKSETAEREAAAKLRLAQTMIHSDKWAAAEKWLLKIVADYPHTKSAGVALKILRER